MPLGLEHAAKSLFKPFDSEFGSLEADLQMQGEEVKAEIQLAAAQAAHQERRTQQAFRNRANLFHQLTITDSGNTREYRRQTEERRLSKSCPVLYLLKQLEDAQNTVYEPCSQQPSKAKVLPAQSSFGL